MTIFDLSWWDLTEWKDRLTVWLNSAPWLLGTISLSDYDRIRAEFIAGMRRAGATDEQIRIGLEELNRQVLSRDHAPSVDGRIKEIGGSLEAIISKTADTVGDAAGKITSPLVPVLGLAAVGLVAIAAIQRRG